MNVSFKVVEVIESSSIIFGLRAESLTGLMKTTFLASKAEAALPPFRPKLTVENIFLARGSDSSSAAARLFTPLLLRAPPSFPPFLSTPFFGRGQEAKMNRLQSEREMRNGERGHTFAEHQKMHIPFGICLLHFSLGRERVLKSLVITGLAPS